MRREYQGAAQSARLTTSLGGTTGDLTIYCDDLSNWPTGVSGRPFYVVIDRNTSAEEKILCASRSGNVLTVESGGRGADDTSITAHSNNAVIEHVFTATDADEANAHVNDTTTDVHPQYVLESTVNAKGDILVGTANDTVSRIGVGSNGQVLTAASGEATGLTWTTPNPAVAYALSAARLGYGSFTGITPSDSISALGTVNWPVGRFSQVPVVQLSIGGDGTYFAPGTYRAILTGLTSGTAPNFYTTVFFSNANQTTSITKLSADITAIQMSSGSATG